MASRIRGTQATAVPHFSGRWDAEPRGGRRQRDHTEGQEAAVGARQGGHGVPASCWRPGQSTPCPSPPQHTPASRTPFHSSTAQCPLRSQLTSQQVCPCPGHWGQVLLGCVWRLGCNCVSAPGGPIAARVQSVPGPEWAQAALGEGAPIPSRTNQAILPSLCPNGIPVSPFHRAKAGVGLLGVSFAQQIALQRLFPAGHCAGHWRVCPQETPVTFRLASPLPPRSRTSRACPPRSAATLS